MPEEYDQIVQEIYGSSKTQVVTQKGETEYFPIEVGLQQGSALSPLLFVIIMDVLTENIEKDLPWSMMITDDLVLWQWLVRKWRKTGKHGELCLRGMG